MTYRVHSTSFSICRSLLYFATRSPRAGAPDFINPARIATAKSAITVHDVSPDLCEIIVLIPASSASLTASAASVTVPI